MLVLKDVTCGYGGRPVLRDINLSVEPGSVLTVLGANGAGKTTLLKTIVGVLKPIGGSILLDGEELSRRNARDRFRAGIVWVPEGRRLFSELTVRENLEFGAVRTGNVAGRWDQLFELFPVLTDYLDRPSSALSGGEQQMVALGRAFLSEPRVLLLDEPSLGLAPQLVEAVMRSISQLRTDRMSVILVEQNVRAGLSIAQEAVVLDHGTVARRGTADELLADDSIVASYLSDSA